MSVRSPMGDTSVGIIMVAGRPAPLYPTIVSLLVVAIGSFARILHLTRIHRFMPATRPHLGTLTSRSTLNGRPARHRIAHLVIAPIWCHSRRQQSVDPGLIGDQRRPDQSGAYHLRDVRRYAARPSHGLVGCDDGGYLDMIEKVGMKSRFRTFHYMYTYMYILECFGTSIAAKGKMG